MAIRPTGPADLAVAPPRQVTIIGHNSQILPTVGFFVAGGIPVQVYTSSEAIIDSLAPYPGVTASLVGAAYDAQPAGFPGPPYFIGIEDPETLERVRTWLPATTAQFLVRRESRRRPRPPGLLSLLPAQSDNRSQVLRRLQALARVDTLLDLCRGKRQPLILMYGDPDPDAVGAAMGLAAIWRRTGASPLLRYTGEIRRYQNKLLISYLKQPIQRLEASELSESDLVAVVDAQPGFWREDPPRPHVVIDHHPRREDTSAPFLDLREGYGATSTILTEYLMDADIPVDRKLATALLYGIVTDTDDLKRNASSNDIRAFDLLHERADRHFIARLEKSQVPMAMLDYIAWGISHRVVYGEMILVHFGRLPHADVCVQVADLLLLTCGVTWVVCAALVGNTLVAVFRGDGHRQDVGKRATLAFARLGSAGGHRTMGRAEVPVESGSVSDSVEILVNNLFRRMRERRRNRFIRTLKSHLQARRPIDPDEFELSA
jgi:nanoRNase/pAp phosphatase (c-di-AMP/oligoRNAs hydrolase)